MITRGSRQRQRRTRRLFTWVMLWVLVVVSLVATARPAAAASTLGLDKTASVTAAQPGDEFRYTLVPRCSGLTESCINAVLTDTLPPEIEVTALPESNPERTVTFDETTRVLRIVFTIPLTAPSPPGSVGLPAGSSRNLELGVRLPADSQVADGTTITNTARLIADNAPAVTAPSEVDVDVPRVVRPVATKTWSDGSAVAGSGEASTITLGVRNASSSTAQVASLTIEDQTPDVFERFSVTGIGPVTFPAGADQIIVQACTAALSACSDATYTSSAAQAGPGLTFPSGVTAAQVTGLRFVFSNAAGTPLPFSPNAGSVQVATVLRDTLRSSGATYSPTSRDDVDNCVSPSGTDPELGDVSGSPACATYAVQPAQATMTLDKTFFADSNTDYTPNGQAVDGESSLVSGLVTATNTSPFPVATITIAEPSTTAPGEFAKFDLSNTRLTFPAGATTAALVFDCAGTIQTQTFVPPPATRDVAVPCATGRADAITVTYSGTDNAGNGTIQPGARAILGIQGRLNGNVTAADLVGGASAGVQNCASGTATSSINGVGSAAAGGCASVPVQPAFTDLQGVKNAERPVILPGLPRRIDLSFTNRGTIPATGVTLLDPVDPTAATNPFDTVRLGALTVPATPAATVEVYDPDVDDYVSYDAGDSALLARSRGFRVQLTGPLAADQRYALSASVVLRDGVASGTTFQNCAGVRSDNNPLRSFCSQAITATEPTEGASVQKAISPATSVRPQPGLPGQTIQVKLAAQNTGTLWLKRLVVTDTDADFFDAVNVTGTVRVNFPPQANRVQVDVCTSDCAGGTFINGTRTGSQNPPLPAGVDAADVRGFRVTFSVADDSFTIRPGANFPTSGPCTAASVCINVIPRATLHSNPDAATPTELADTASGGYETTRQNGALADIPSSAATHTLTRGTAQLRFDKSSDINATPGEPIPFTLSLTNTGTGPLPNPVIVDPLPDELEFAPSSPLQPFSYTVVQPTGAPDSPEPVFEPTRNDTGRVTDLSWRFDDLTLLPGGTITVTFQVQLSPGTTAGATATNRAGGSADRPDLGCADGGRRPGTATDDDDYGAGLYCTSASVVRTLAGNAIRTEKWVGGDTTLGWMNSVTGDLIPIGDDSCPRLEVGDQLFTRYPCVARVAPGQGFDFYLRMTNAGTNPSTEIRVVDVFPAPGDTGVILTDEERGTQWEQSPTLLGPVTLVGPGTPNIAYTADAPACTTDLNRPPVDCAVTDWANAYDPAATAFRSIVGFPGSGLAPGGTTALRFRMAAPPAPTNPSQNMVAWNSYAHTEFFNDNGRTVQLPPTEPIKTGVALVFGDLTVRKTVTGTASTGPFTFAYRCTVTPETPERGTGEPVVASEGTFQLAADEELLLAGQPARGTCAVWETDTAGLISDADGEANAKQVTVPVGGLEAVPVVTIANRAAPTTPTPTPRPTATPDPSQSTTPTASATTSTSPTSGGGGAAGTDPEPSGGSGNLPSTGGPIGSMAVLVVGIVLLLAAAAFGIAAHIRRSA